MVVTAGKCCELECLSTCLFVLQMENIYLTQHGFLELIIFMWIFGGNRAWEEINREGIIKIPRVFYYVLRYVTPFYLMILLGTWGYKALPNVIQKADWTIWVARVYLVGLFIFLAVLVFVAERRKKKEGYGH